MNTARERAEELLVFVAGVEDAAVPCLSAFTGRARTVANDALSLADEVDYERSCRVALQKRIETLEQILMRGPYEYTRAA